MTNCNAFWCTDWLVWRCNAPAYTRTGLRCTLPASSLLACPHPIWISINEPTHSSKNQTQQLSFMTNSNTNTKSTTYIWQFKIDQNTYVKKTCRTGSHLSAWRKPLRFGTLKSSILPCSPHLWDNSHFIALTSVSKSIQLPSKSLRKNQTANFP